MVILKPVSENSWIICVQEETSSNSSIFWRFTGPMYAGFYLIIFNIFFCKNSEFRFLVWLLRGLNLEIGDLEFKHCYPAPSGRICLGISMTHPPVQEHRPNHGEISMFYQHQTETGRNPCLPSDYHCLPLTFSNPAQASVQGQILARK